MDKIRATLAASKMYQARKILKPTNLAFLCHFDNSSEDISSYHTPCQTSPTYSTSGRYGAYCLSGTAAYNANLDFSGDFSIDFQLKSSGNFDATFGSFQIYTDGSNLNLGGRWRAWGNMRSDVFTHHCFFRWNNVLYYYKNGLYYASVSQAGNYSASNITIKGSATVLVNEVRIVTGICPWTSNFTPPTAPYTGFEAL